MPKVLPEYKQEAKKRIIDAAKQTFFRLGYQKTKMTDIGQTLGVSKGAVYQYFKSKEDLFFEVFDQLINEGRTKSMSFLKEAGLDGLKSASYFDNYLIAPGASLAFTVDLVSESLNNEKLNAKLSGFFNQAVKNTELFFDAYKQKGIIKPEIDSKKKALEMFGMLEGLKSLLYYGASLDDVKQVWTSFATEYLNHMKSG